MDVERVRAETANQKAAKGQLAMQCLQRAGWQERCAEDVPSCRIITFGCLEANFFNSWKEKKKKKN